MSVLIEGTMKECLQNTPLSHGETIQYAIAHILLEILKLLEREEERREE